MNSEGRIKEVYSDTIEDEFRIISELSSKYNYISLDTEFPGFVYQSEQAVNQGISSFPSNLITIKKNVDNLKLIQVGLTLSDQYGNFPEEYSTWQFNFKFDLKNDIYSAESITMLENAGINFDTLLKKGIEQEIFAENLIPSGLILNDNINWVSFHGVYDFAYLLKNATNQPLPGDEKTFIENLELYFPNFYDIKQILADVQGMKGSLSKIADDLEIERLGINHQAGSDALLTSKVFLMISNNLSYLVDIENDKNKLFGVSRKNFHNQNNQQTKNNFYGGIYNNNQINQNNFGKMNAMPFNNGNMVNQFNYMNNNNFQQNYYPNTMNNGFYQKTPYINGNMNNLKMQNNSYFPSNMNMYPQEVIHNQQRLINNQINANIPLINNMNNKNIQGKDINQYYPNLSNNVSSRE